MLIIELTLLILSRPKIIMNPDQQKEKKTNPKLFVKPIDKN